MTTHYVITETRQTGGAPRLYSDTLYDNRFDAVEGAAELQRRTGETGRRETYDVWELTHDHDASYDYTADLRVAAGLDADAEEATR